MFRDDAQAASALHILLARLGLDHLWSSTGPTPKAVTLRTGLDGGHPHAPGHAGGHPHTPGASSAGLSPPQQTLLGAAWALWDRKTPAGVRLDEVIQHLDHRTCDALFSLVMAYLEGPRAVDTWLDHARRHAHLLDRAPDATDGAAAAAATPNATWIESLGHDWPTLDLLSLRYIRAVIEQQQGNQARAAQVLGVDRRTLSRVLAKVKSGRIPAMQTRRY